MNWAKERAQKIMGPLKPLINHGMTPQQYDATWNAIAAALQRVADECADVALEEMAKFDALRKTVPDDQLARPLLDKADGAVAACASIRARFPKEEL